MTDLREIWTQIDLMDEATLPPINRDVLMAEKGSHRRRWYNFKTVKQRRFVCSTHSFSHWRNELSVDFA